MTDVSGTFTRNPEVVNASQMRPNNSGLANVMVASPQMSITGFRSPQIRPSNSSVASLLANSNQPVGSGQVQNNDRESNENIQDGGSLAGWRKFKSGLGKAVGIASKIAPIAAMAL